jgi:hypothetical protein
MDITKLRDYCLNANHEEGKHKARVFASALGLRAADAEWMRDQLLKAAAAKTLVQLPAPASAQNTCETST